MADAATALETRGRRLFPIDAGKIIGPVTTVTDIALDLPAGWRAQLPREVEAIGKWGKYSARYEQAGTTLRDALRNVPGIAWLRKMAQDDVTYLVLESGSTP